MIRGGSWNNNPANLRSANRNRNTPTNRNNNVGFRLARTLHRQSCCDHGLSRRAPKRPGPILKNAGCAGPALRLAGPASRGAGRISCQVEYRTLGLRNERPRTSADGVDGRFLTSRCLPRKCLHVLQTPLFRSSGQAVRFRPKPWVRVASVPDLARSIHENRHRRERAAA